MCQHTLIRRRLFERLGAGVIVSVAVGIERRNDFDVAPTVDRSITVGIGEVLMQIETLKRVYVLGPKLDGADTHRR